MKARIVNLRGKEIGKTLIRRRRKAKIITLKGRRSKSNAKCDFSSRVIISRR